MGKWLENYKKKKKKRTKWIGEWSKENLQYWKMIDAILGDWKSIWVNKTSDWSINSFVHLRWVGKIYTYSIYFIKDRLWFQIPNVKISKIALKKNTFENFSRPKKVIRLSHQTRKKRSKENVIKEKVSFPSPYWSNCLLFQLNTQSNPDQFIWNETFYLKLSKIIAMFFGQG